jgi:hypothetical protein
MFRSLVCLALDWRRPKWEKHSQIEMWKKERKTFVGKQQPKRTPFSPCSSVENVFRLFYSKLFFMTICEYKKLLRALLFIRLSCFLLLIDFLLHIMGIQFRIIKKSGERREGGTEKRARFSMRSAFGMRCSCLCKRNFFHPSPSWMGKKHSSAELEEGTEIFS